MAKSFQGFFLRALALAMVGMVGVAKSQPFSPTEVNQMLGYFLANFDISGTGAVVASPSTSEPDYYYHWVRDAAISMNVMLSRGFTPAASTLLQHYTSWEIHAQNQPDPNGIDILGEPKYFIPSGKAYDGPWGRPQNDGPALRAIVLTNFANILFGQQGGLDYILKYLYRPSLNDPGCIKTDLEYVAHHWQDDSFCLWEEVNGKHFFTRMVQRKALLVGADLADRMNDTGASTYYRQQAASLATAIRQHWNPSTGVIMATLPPHGGPQKFEELDTAVYLGVLYGHVTGDSLYPPTDPQLVSTIARLTTVFRDGSFPINQKDDQANVPGTLYGRYPNDTYTGTGNGHGNPWFLTTNALAEIYYLQAKALRADTFRLTAEHREAFARLLPHLPRDALLADTIANALVSEADNLLLRIRYHCQAEAFHMPEQINYITGNQQGAHDLTWSYGTVLSAMLSRP